MKRMGIILCLVNSILYCYEKQCNPQYAADATALVVDATYYFFQDQEICYILLSDEEKRDAQIILEPLKNLPLNNKTLEKIPASSTAKRIVQDFLLHKNKEQNAAGPLYKTIQDVLDTINPQGYAHELSGADRVHH